MSSWTSRRVPLFSLALALALACESSTAPRSIPGVYSLTDVAGDPVPAVLWTGEGLRLHVLYEVIRLRGDGTGTLHGARENEQFGPGVTAERRRFTLDSEFTYRVVRGQIQIAFRCPPNALCTAPPHLVGRATPGGLRLKATSQPRPLPLTYSRTTTPLAELHREPQFDR